MQEGVHAVCVCGLCVCRGGLHAVCVYVYVGGMSCARRVCVVCVCVCVGGVPPCVCLCVCVGG